jgi:outer membrane lipoprotein-sorting protein
MVCVFLVAIAACGCSMQQTTVVKPGSVPAPAQNASKEELISAFNTQADAYQSLNAGMTMTLTAGSAYSGVIKQYHEVNGFILAQRPLSIRVIGQLPVVGTNIFDMVSDGKTFAIFIPSQNKFITGPADLERQSSKPIENLRPQHLIEALFWRAIGKTEPVLIEEAAEGLRQYYVLTVVRAGSAGATAESVSGSNEWRIDRKIWFDRADLQVSRLTTYDPGGKIASDIRYGAWNEAASPKYPAQIELARPGNDYDLKIGITKVMFNEPVTADRFVLPQPPSAELVRVGDDSATAAPSGSKAAPK